MAMNKGSNYTASGRSREVAFVAELTVCRASCALGAVSGSNRSLRPARISLLPPAQIARCGRRAIAPAAGA